MSLARRRILAKLTKPELITVIVDGCPVCTTGSTRETTGMVCQHCGKDYAALVDELSAELAAGLSDWLTEDDETTEHEIRRHDA